MLIKGIVYIYLFIFNFIAFVDLKVLFSVLVKVMLLSGHLLGKSCPLD